MTYFDPNPWAILVAAAVAFVFGAAWYSPPVFGRVWMCAHGYADLTDERQEEMKRAAKKAHLVSFVAFLFMASALACLQDYIVLSSTLQALKLGVLVWVGFVAPVGLMANAYSDRPLAAWAVDGGYQLIYLLGMSLVLTLWQ